MAMVPKITGVVPFSIISPQGAVILLGANFGDEAGTLWLKGGFNGTREMTVDSWTDGGIGAFFPSATAIGPISGLNLTLQVETSFGGKSNEWPLQWVQEVKVLDTSSVGVYACGGGGNVNSCNWQLDVGSMCFSSSNTTDMILESKPPDPACSPCTAVGFHGNCRGAVGDDTGTDVYLIGPLKNSWVLADFTFQDSLPQYGSCDDAVAPPGFQMGGNQWTPAISWCVTPADELFYRLWVYIVGPKGFPHM